MLPNKSPSVYRVENDLGASPRGVEVILLGDNNVQLQEPRDAQEEDIPTDFSDCRMVDMIAHFTLWRWYIGGRCWTWRMK